jgi:predicted nucleic acid-binding protein
VKAEEVYIDPSALARLYLHQAGSQEIAAWRAKTRGSVPVTHHGRIEVVNAICRSAFLGHLDSKGMAEALADLDEDFVVGRMRRVDILWRAALDRAGELSRVWTPRLGARALDVLHVACALELGLRDFLTFDERQEELARSVGLKIVRI